MTEIERIIYTALFTALATVISGSIVFVTKELISKFLLEPIHEQKRIIAEVIFTLLHFDSVYFSTWDIEEKAEYDRLIVARQELREKGSRLVSTSYTIPCYWFWRFPFGLPSKGDLLSVGLLILAIGDMLGTSHFPDEAMELSKLKSQVISKLKVKIPGLSD